MSTYSDKDTNAVYALNSYTWKVLQANLGLTTEMYDGKVPIIPTQQQPELLQSARPFLVYGSTVVNQGHLYQLTKETVAYTIYATKSTDANNIVSLLSKALGRQDDTATDINNWLNIEPAGSLLRNRQVSFGSVDVRLAERADPADEEGGFVVGSLLLEIVYIETGAEPVTSFVS